MWQPLDGNICLESTLEIIHIEILLFSLHFHVLEFIVITIFLNFLLDVFTKYLYKKDYLTLIFEI